jgi:cation diffusion facilitator CzcD-associated flavoprotein CzcO
MGRVCIIGAGSSGIASCQVLHARGIPFDCFEAGSEIGGNWRYGNDNGMSSAYRSLHSPLGCGRCTFLRTGEPPQVADRRRR